MTYPKFRLLIKTNHYTGNFGRELMAYCFGVWNEYGNTNKFTDNFTFKYGSDDEIFPLHHFYDEYGITSYQIENTNNLSVYFEDRLTEQCKTILKERLETFPEFLKNKEFAAKDLKIVGLEYYKIEVEEKRWHYE
jgi:hypothetical protein